LRIINFTFDTENPLKTSLLPSIVLGGILSILFYGAIHNGWIQQPLVLRYFAGHPIEYITTVMFLVGLAILLVRYFTIITQRQLLRCSPILVPSQYPVPLSYAGDDLITVQEYEKEHGISLLTERLKTHLYFLHRSNSARNLDAEIRIRAEDAATKADTNYGLIRLLLWAIPMIGFLGTVIGITTALDNLDLNMMSESSKKLSAGLAVAFDTTGLAISLAVVLFFVQFLVYREESNLLTETDRLTEMELCGRYEQNDQQKEDEVIVTVRRMLETITDSIEQVTRRQTNIWEQSAGTFTAALTSALNENMQHHAKSLVNAESILLDQTNKATIQFSNALSKCTAGVVSLQEETARQTDTVREILGANSQLIRLEERLHENLATLAQVGNFEETVNSLAAAIHLLNSNRRSELRAG
jgi:biopolymer transport protein ExbB/TolQ